MQFPRRLPELKTAGSFRRVDIIGASPTLRILTLLAAASAMLAGCQKAPPPPETAVAAESPVGRDVGAPPARGAVELQDATGILDEEKVVRFEIKYRFTAGSPSKVYLVEISFPGTDRQGLKPMEAFELKSEGTIKTGIEVGDAPVNDFQITLSEADSPDRGYFLISNTLTGTVQLARDRRAD